MLYNDFHWAILLMFIPAYYFQLFVHEMSHVWVAQSLGYSDIKFDVYAIPKRWNGTWLMSYFSYTIEQNSIHPGDYRMWIAPFKVAVALSILFSGCFVFLSWAYMPAAVAAAIDAVWFWKGYFFGPSLHDGARYRTLRRKI